VLVFTADGTTDLLWTLQVVAFVAGFALQSLRLSMGVFGAGSLVLMLVGISHCCHSFAC
jgi:hypothetical protein